ncbi:MAG TPA: hypothetical protein VGR81_00900 [Candidatus Acidoferrales bacterium]|nr:hypothetical protein [Candidatus Acidoferrales bacterium]
MAKEASRKRVGASGVGEYIGKTPKEATIHKTDNQLHHNCL